MIVTISDLENASDKEIEKARKSVSFKKLLEAQLKKDGSKPGLTYDEWEEKAKNRKAKECETCRGTGEVMEKLRTVGTIHASSSSRCVTRLYYDVTGEIAPKEELSIALLITFAIGHAIHDVAQKAMHRAMKDNFEDEVRVDLPEALILDGSADGVGWFPLCRAGLEIKTMSEREFATLRKPKPEHIVQASALYSKGLDVPFMSFLYISKGWPHSMKEYVIAYDEKRFRAWYREKAGKVEEALETGKPPRADASKYECKDCGYSYECPQALGFRRDPLKRK